MTVTAIDFWTALLPKLSLALTVIVSEAVEASSSVSVVRSAFTCASVPLIVSVLPPFDGVTVPPPPAAPVFAASTPWVSGQSDGERLAAGRRIAAFRDTDAGNRRRLALRHRRRPGAVSTGSPFTVIAVVVCVAAFAEAVAGVDRIVSGPAVPSVSLRLASAVFTCTSVPVNVTSVEPPPATPAPPALPVVSRPLPSDTVTE